MDEIRGGDSASLGVAQIPGTAPHTHRQAAGHFAPKILEARLFLFCAVRYAEAPLGELDRLSIRLSNPYRHYLTTTRSWSEIRPQFVSVQSLLSAFDT